MFENGKKFYTVPDFTDKCETGIVICYIRYQGLKNPYLGLTFMGQP